jgi:hypothetical protein
MVSPEILKNWIDVLENILHDADALGATRLAIHIDSALIEARRALGDEKAPPRHDHLPNDDKIS